MSKKFCLLRTILQERCQAEMYRVIFRVKIGYWDDTLPTEWVR